MSEKEIHEWELKRTRVMNNCPRGKYYFCGGTVNKSYKGWEKLTKLGKCPHRKEGKCTYPRINKDEV